MNRKNRETTGIAVAAGIILTAVAIPHIIAWLPKCPEKRFADGGKEMLSAVPDIASKYCKRLVRL